MRCIEVQTEPSYQVWIGPALTSQIGKLLSPIVGSHSVIVLSDMYVDPLYGEAVCSAIEDYGIEVKTIPFMADENSKNLELVESLLSTLTQQSVSRNDVLLSLGGGLAIDVVTMAAALYLRGVKVVHMPTTLVAMVDAAIGGKADINSPEGRDMAGVNYQSELVVADIDLLSSLPEHEIRNGMGEIIKYAVLRKNTLYGRLREHVGRTHMDELERIIGDCAEIKAEIVSQHPTSSMRDVLDLGRMPGQAIEDVTDNAIGHGEAIGLGMLIMAYGTGNTKTGDRIKALLDEYGLLTSFEWPERELISTALFKKNTDAYYTIVVPEEIGKVEVKRIRTRELTGILKKGLNAVRPKKESGKRLRLKALRRARS